MSPRSLERQLQSELMARGIRNCTDLNELKAITFKLLEMCESQKSIMLHWMRTH